LTSSSDSTVLSDEPETAIMRLGLNRPATLNAYTSRLCAELLAGLKRYADRDDLRCLILTGQGRGFCAGGDMIETDPSVPGSHDRQLGHAGELRDGIHTVIRALFALDKPVIAMINGAAAAGGLALALCCDFRIAAESARLGDASGRFALLPDDGGAWLFPRAMGLDRALRMTLLNEIYSAEEAQKLGLVTEVVPDAVLEDRTMEIARHLVQKAPLAVRLAKSLMRRGLDGSLDRSLEDAALAAMIANASADVREGVSAFFARRSPIFSGR
jgi:2-(1,2-epoxy-1,2-dihydrophenyl)acetyl-CoA isomerase